MPTSLRQIASTMDPLAEKQSSIQLSSVLKQHRWPPGVPASNRGLREVIRRHSQCASIRFLSYNTYLLEAHITLPDPFPDVRLTAKPALHARAREIGQRVVSEYDFASLYEVMQGKQRNEILAAWGPSPPDNFFGEPLSGLFTVSQKFKIGRREIYTFRKKGKEVTIDALLKDVVISLDSDFYADKGVMFTEIVTPFGIVEVYSTHLMFGGGLPKAAQDAINTLVPFGDHISPSSPSERFSIQMIQLDELIEFYKQHHRQENVAIICGDFNIDGANVDHFLQLKNRLAAIRMKDAWADGPFINNLAGGQTARNDDDDTKPQEVNFDNVCTELTNGKDYCNDAQSPKHPLPPECVGRFDYIFVEDPHPLHRCDLDLSRVRRRQFRRSQPSESQSFLSDHLGLETQLFVSKRFE
ncbi:MAG: hypothetical protein OEV99_07320 [Nitrospira sp.]|nr:hypothetical protein [Nitrospira sp.]MDH5193166.1 hypothetical protein [Nitrospira sp.]